jgi:hypothetical protein
MKRILLLFFAVIFSTSFAFGQTAQATSSDKPDSQNPATVARVAIYSQLSDAEKKILVDYLTSRASMGFCAYVPDGTGCKENGNYEQKYIDALEAIVKSPRLTSYLVSNAAQKFEGTKIGARSAPQVSQIADEQNAELTRILVIQNQRIIDLLEQLVKKK